MSLLGESRLRLSADDNDDNEGMMPNDDETTEPPPSTSTTSTTTKDAVNAVTSIVDKASEYLVLLAGVGVAGSLAINALGYGFAAQPGGGVRFDTIKQLRTERQMERSVDRPELYTVQQKDPVATFFRKNSLLVTFGLVGASLLVEESKARKDK